MGDALILETTFLIDLEREARAGKSGAAHRFLADRREVRLCLTTTTAGELAAGLLPEERGMWEQLLQRFQVLPVDADVCWKYGRLYRYLKSNGLLIGANDLWIAATAVVHDLPLVTRNEAHFRRVPDLRVLGYAQQ